MRRRFRQWRRWRHLECPACRSMAGLKPGDGIVCQCCAMIAQIKLMERGLDV